jgi:hypothetical protein
MHSALRSLLIVCLLAAACAGASPPPAGAQEQPLDIRSSTLPFKIDDPAAKRVGSLAWRGGIAMTANSRNFGGWSDLHVSPDGRTLTSISDEGAWLTATIDYAAVSGHKLYAPKGIGFLYVREGAPLKPLMAGGYIKAPQVKLPKRKISRARWYLGHREFAIHRRNPTF